MCGIVAYIGTNTKEKVLDSLYKLEYRGYDSCGVSYFENDTIKLVKQPGKISNLEKALNSTPLSSPTIAHTRWATHGKPSTENSHPHTDSQNQWHVVHNGIIENYYHIKNTQLKNVNFSSTTDTEVIPHLCAKFGNDLSSFYKAIKMLDGSFAIAAMNVNQKSIYLAKNNAPLYIATNNTEVTASSDIISFKKGDNLYELKDGEFAEIKEDKTVIFYDKNLNILNKKSIVIKEQIQCSSKDNFEYHTIKEIFATPTCYDNLKKFYRTNPELKKLDNIKFNKIMIIGCGSAYHTGLAGAAYLEKFNKVETHTYLASEFRYNNPIIDKNTLCVFISQSGETADTLACLELAKKKKATLLAITNTTRSSLARKSDIVLDMKAGIEIGVATTKAFNCGVLVLYILAYYLKHHKVNTRLFNKLKAETINILSNQENIIKVAQAIKNEDKCFYLGRKLDYCIAQEGCLKLKEIAYINCSAFASGELKHGSLALIEDGTYCFSICTDNSIKNKHFSNIQEVKARGGRIINISPNNFEVLNGEYNLTFNSVSPCIDILLTATIMQLIAYHTTILKGYNPDQPRNLAKSVTVE